MRIADKQLGIADKDKKIADKPSKIADKLKKIADKMMPAEFMSAIKKAGVKFQLTELKRRESTIKLKKSTINR